MSNVNDLLERLERAVDIYAQLVATIEADNENRSLLAEPAKKMRWAIRDLANEIWLTGKQ